MIVKRKNVKFSDLMLTDYEAAKIFIDAFNDSYLGCTKERKQEIYKSLITHSKIELEMGCCFDKLGDVIKGFDKLDKESPYDDGK